MTTPDHPAHSLLGASSAHRWLNCPGSFKLSQTAPHRPSSIYAATGTLAHEMIEGAVKSGNDTVVLDDPGPVLRDGHMIEVDQDFVDGVNVMLDYFYGLSALADWTDVEFRVDLAGYFPTPPPVPVFGTVDAAIHSWNDETLEVVDYKNGSGITVSVVENPQLLFYAAGVLSNPAVEQQWVRTVRLTIVQPHAGGAPIRSWDLNVVDLLMWISEVLVPGVEACAQPDAPLNPGSWCRFCPVSHACPRLMADALEMAKQEFNDDVLTGAAPADTSEADTSELAKALDTAERAQLWIDRIQEFAVEQLKRQERIPGWGLVPTRATRKWLLPERDIVDRLTQLGVTQEDLWETRVRSPAQMDKTLHRTRDGSRLWDQGVSPLIEARSSGVKLGRDTNTAREDFNDDDDIGAR